MLVIVVKCQEHINEINEQVKFDENGRTTVSTKHQWSGILLEANIYH